ncbi:hypothetical protein ABG067_003535 [Albugo candida]|uniref:Uncharacterized protein n=1 Tax=Albugo candida TaxID=65357 RepID=A0A024GC60_9STRA|nr:unnamed protein product [Albugo candida]|eukprot:CCI44423.1 unnamed protein product [Albugo candida]
MGASITIMNDTGKDWRCLLSPDHKALGIASVVSLIISIVSTIVYTGAIIYPWIEAMSAAGRAKWIGVSVGTWRGFTTAMLPFANTAAGIGAVSTFSVCVARAINELLDTRGYVIIPAGGYHRFDPMGPWLWQQGTCVNVSATNATNVHTETICMRPIFSGSIFHHERRYGIQSWIDKKGTVGSDYRAFSNSSTGTPQTQQNSLIPRFKSASASFTKIDEPPSVLSNRDDALFDRIR